MSQFFAFMSVINTRSLRARWAPSSMPAGHPDPSDPRLTVNHHVSHLVSHLIGHIVNRHAN